MHNLQDIYLNLILVKNTKRTWYNYHGPSMK